MTFSAAQLVHIPHTLSELRFATYLNNCDNDREKALILYKWNLEISSAFLVPLHLLEVSIRNAVVECLDAVYTSNWPWNERFIRSLPHNHKSRFNLQKVASQQPTMGKVVADLKFVFWEEMFTSRHDVRLWNEHLKAVFPYSPNAMRVSQLREIVFNDMSSIRKLRNRIAHHEPIFHRNAQDDYDKMQQLITWRDVTTADWMNSFQSVTQLIVEKPC